MPEIGDFALGQDIGKHRRCKYIWRACIDCGKEWWVLYSMIERRSGRCRSCAGKRYIHPIGSKSPKWGGGRCTDIRGYISVWLSPSNFFAPMRTKKGNVLEHRLIVAKSLGRNLHPWEEVHHKGTKFPRGSKEDKADNRIENLEIMTKGNHAAEHNKGYRDGYAKGLTDGRNKQIEELRQEIKLVQFQNKQLLEKILKQEVMV